MRAEGRARTGGGPRAEEAWRPVARRNHPLGPGRHGGGAAHRRAGLGPDTHTTADPTTTQTRTHTPYEHPTSLKERVHLITGGDYWPWATSTSRGVDYDHPSPYVLLDHGGPPGQTGTHNSGPLGRRHHKWKTHAGYRAPQSGAGRYVGTTPNGLAFIVDANGSRLIDPDQARAILDAPAGLEIYFAPFDIVVDLDPN